MPKRGAVEQVFEDPIEAMIGRARRARRKGDERKMLVLLRQAAAHDEDRPRTWALLGALCAHLGRLEEAARALKQARWLRLQAGETGRVRGIDVLLARVALAA